MNLGRLLMWMEKWLGPGAQVDRASGNYQSEVYSVSQVNGEQRFGAFL